MESFLIYLLKAGGVLSIFYLVYQVFLKRETFFIVNRHFLIVGILAAILVPFIEITRYIEVSVVSPESVNFIGVTGSLSESSIQIDWISVLFVIYVLGAIFLSLHFIVQLFSLSKLVRVNRNEKKDGFVYVETDKDIAPFSFFSHIFYNPALYSASEMKAILKHEEAHSRQWHSFDVILSHLLTVFIWPSPFSWLYQKNLKLNLEFLADETAIKKESSIKKYQYALLRVSGNQFCTPIVNNFYSSLIKKRIVMLNKTKSNRKNLLKTTLIIPALALFLYSFNSNEIYVIKEGSTETSLDVTEADKKIEIRIDKDTSNEELEKIKKNLAKKGFDFSYTVVHNEQSEITSLSIDVKSKGAKNKQMSGSSTFYNDGAPINPVTVVMDDENTMFFMGDSDAEMIHEDDDNFVWVHKDSKKIRTVNISEENGKKTIRVNGKKVTQEEYEKMKGDEEGHETHHIKIKKSKGGNTSDVMIIKDSDDDNDIEVIGDDHGFFFIDVDGDDNGLFLIDGKEASREEVKALSQDDIEKIEVSKGKGATEKYGKKAKDGVVEVTTKKD